MTAGCPHCSFGVADRPHEIANEATAAARPLIEARLADIRQVFESAEGFDDAARRLIELAATWKPAALAALLGSSLVLAALEGREAVWQDMDEEGFSAPLTTSLATNAISQSFDLQAEFLRQKRPAPTRVWTDAMQGDHDRKFVIAGATDIAMLEEFQAAIVDGAKTYDFKAFTGEFDRIVEKYGWSYRGNREWRIRTIFETNIRTSYMAGRLAQMRDPDVVSLMPWWQYIHGESRTPLQPRPLHLSWDGLLALWDDPWWDKHFPPNDWVCSCGVRSMSERRARQQARWGQIPPKDIMRGVLDRTNQRTVQMPQGIGLGWDYQPGKLWERGLVPSALEAEGGELLPDGRHAVRIDEPQPLPALVEAARPFEAEPLPLNLPDEDYVTAFLQPFGATIGRAVLWTDTAGVQIPISDELFRESGTGLWKVGKRDRATLTPLMAETLMDPDEIWVGLARKIDKATGREELIVDRRYVRTDGKTGLMIVFEMGRKWWEAVTAYNPTKKNRQPDAKALDARRGGKLVYKRGEDD